MDEEKYETRICPSDLGIVPLSHRGPFLGDEYVIPEGTDEEKIKDLLYGKEPREVFRRDGKIAWFGDIAFAAYPSVNHVPSTWRSLYFLYPSLVGYCIFQVSNTTHIRNWGEGAWKGPYGKTGDYPDADNGYGFILLPNGATRKISTLQTKECLFEFDLRGVGDSSACQAEAHRFNTIHIVVTKEGGIKGCEQQ